MPTQSNAIRVVLTQLGQGEVVLDLPAGDLLTTDETIPGPRAVSTKNLRLVDNLATARPGYALLGTSPTTDIVLGLLNAIFDDGTSNLVRADENTIYSWNGSTWTVRTPTPALSGGSTDYFSLAMVERIGSVSPKNQVFIANGVDGIHKWTGTGVVTAVSGSPTGARVLVPFLNRCWAMNLEDGSANRKHARVQWSISGDPETWTGLGSGVLDLDDDPFRIANATVMGGAMVIYKGGVDGGSLWYATRTGVVNNPLRYDALNPGVGVGLLLPRSLILLSPAIASFFGHDGWYLHDGLRSLIPIAVGITKSLLSRINRGAIDAAFSWYRPRTREIYLAIPTGAATTPNEVWVYNMQTQKANGPYDYADNLTAVAPFVSTGALTWDTLPGPSWDTLPYSSWDTIGVGASAHSTVFGTDAGDAMEDTDDPVDTDNGAAISASYTSGEIHAIGRVLPGQLGRRGVSGDLLTLMTVRLTYKDDRAWTPEVQASTDGGTSWTTISNGVEVGGGTTRLRNVTYTSGIITAERFLIRVNGANANLHTIHNEFVYAGDEESS